MMPAKSAVPNRQCQIGSARMAVPNRQCQIGSARMAVPEWQCQIGSVVDLILIILEKNPLSKILDSGNVVQTIALVEIGFYAIGTRTTRTPNLNGLRPVSIFAFAKLANCSLSRDAILKGRVVLLREFDGTSRLRISL